VSPLVLLLLFAFGLLSFFFLWFSTVRRPEPEYCVSLRYQYGFFVPLSSLFRNVRTESSPRPGVPHETVREWKHSREE
jgi:hypothetical protein